MSERKNPAGKSLPAVWSRPIEGEEFTSSDHVYEASQRLVEAGLSVIPICEPTTHRGLFPDNASWTFLLSGPTTHRGDWWRNQHLFP
jgi:hypothetical protein